jgi:hypothetical protein
VSVSDLLIAYAVLGIPVGLLAGLGLGLVARREEGWGGYGSFRRRAARLGHVAAVMLPVVAGFYGLALRAVPVEEPLSRVATWLWVIGSPSLAVALFAAAWRPRLVAALPAPALAVVAGASCFALALAGA